MLVSYLLPLILRQLMPLAKLFVNMHYCLTYPHGGKEDRHPTPKWNTRVYLEKCKKKPGIMKSGLDATPLFLQVDMLKNPECDE